MKIFFIAILFIVFINPLYAVDYSEMSTQELIVIMGYVEKKNEAKFKKELQSRVPTMSPKEKAQYEANLKKMKK